MQILVPLTRGKFAEIDQQDADRVLLHSWRVHCAGRGKPIYAATRIDGRVVLMHRMLANASNSECVDHRDGDGLNNRRTNLRRCSQSENKRNRKKRCVSSSRFKGVYRDGECWRAQIIADKRRTRMRFPTQLQAALAYDPLAVKLHGDFARTNFPEATRMYSRAFAHAP